MCAVWSGCEHRCDDTMAETVTDPGIVHRTRVSKIHFHTSSSIKYILADKGFATDRPAWNSTKGAGLPSASS